MRPDRLVVGSLPGVAAEIALAQAEGVSSVIAAARSGTLRQAIARLTAELATTRPGTSVEAAKETLAATFDLVLEVGRTKDGRARLLRVAEMRYEGSGIVTRDIFLFSVERTAASGAVEGTLHPTGNVPVIVEDLSLRGINVDPGLFRRTVVR
jgi:pilus assembly protein CpaF